MARLFLRFYLGVVLILILAWLIQSYVYQTQNQKQNARVVENALSGGFRSVRDELVKARNEEREAVFERIVQRFDYPVNPFRLSDDWVTDDIRTRLQAGDVVLVGPYHVVISLVNDEQDDSITSTAADLKTLRGAGLVFGPLPQFVGPSLFDTLLGYAGIFLLAAIAIAVLLRPVVAQLQDVERAALAIAKGDLSARAQARSLPLTRSFNDMAGRMESVLRSQRELFQAVSHELRTPLARIRFATELVETARTDEQRGERIASINDATERLDELVGELLEYTRLDSAAPIRDPERVAVGPLVEDLVEIHRPLHPGVKFEITPRISELFVLADRAGFSRAIENLLSNAGYHAKETVLVAAEACEQFVTITVDDDGEGIADAERNNVFEPFIRLDNSAERPGSGLGLALVSRIAGRNGGHIELDTGTLGGARFRLRFPRTTPSDP